jgi:hypothetical protein
MPNPLRVGKGLRTYALRHSTGEKSVEAASSQWDTTRRILLSRGCILG